MNPRLPKLPPVNGRRLIDLEASIATAMHHNFRQFADAAALHDIEAATARLTRATATPPATRTKETR